MGRIFLQIRQFVNIKVSCQKNKLKKNLNTLFYGQHTFRKSFKAAVCFILPNNLLFKKFFLNWNSTLNLWNIITSYVSFSDYS